MTVSASIQQLSKAKHSTHSTFSVITVMDADGSYVDLFLMTPNHATVAACVVQYLNEEIDQPPPPPPVAEDTDDVGF